MLPAMNTDAWELPPASSAIKAAKAALPSPEWWLTNPINKAALKALLAKYEKGITGTASPSARCLGGFAGEKVWQCPVGSVRLTPPNSSQPLALGVIYFIYFTAPIIPRASLARECACDGATALSIISNGRSLSAGAWRDGNNGEGTWGWMEHQEHSSQLYAGAWLED